MQTKASSKENMYESTSKYLFGILWRKMAWTIILCYLIAMLCKSLLTLRSKGELGVHVWYYMLAILGCCMTLQIARWCLEYNEVPGEGRSPYIKGTIDIMANTILFVACYISTFNLNLVFALTGAFIGIFNIFRSLWYRIRNDIFLYKIYTKHSKRFHTSKNIAGHFFLRCLFDLFPRLYLYIAFSFSTFQMLLSTRNIQIANGSAKSFVDIFYYNLVAMLTLDYANITPLSLWARIVTLFEIIVSVVILTIILALLLGKFQKMAEEEQ